MALNKVILMGRFTRDIEIMTTSNSMLVCKNCIAVNRYSKKDHPEADFVPVTFFGKTAELVGRSYAKGSEICIEGHIQTGTYTDKDGNKRNSFDVIADNIHFFGSSKKNSDEASNTNETPVQTSRSAPEPDTDIAGSKLPF